MTVPADPAARHRQVAAGFTRLVRGTRDWSAPAPVAGWTASDVVEHLVGWSTGLLAGHGVVLAGLVDHSDPATTWVAHADGVQGLLDDPASARVVIHSPHFPEMTLPQTIDRLYTTDVFMHTWDLARATGQDAELDEEHCAELLAGMEPLDGVLRASGHYGARVDVSVNASAQDRLMGFIGRDPSWAPPDSR